MGMKRDRIKGMARDFLLDTIQGEVSFSDFHRLLLNELSRKGKLLSDEPDPTWAELIMAVGDLLGVSAEQVFPVALATEFILLSGDLYDDVMDRDQLHREDMDIPAEKLLLFANWVLMLAFHCVLISPSIQTEIKQLIIDTFNRSILHASWGQWKNEEFSFPKMASEQDYLDVVRLKAGKFGELACASVAVFSRDSRQMELWKKIGSFIGMAGQMKNDAADILTDEKNDLITLKMTLPMIKGLECSLEKKDGFYELICKGYQDRKFLWNHREEVRSYLLACGAVDYSYILSRVYLEKAFQMIERFFGHCSEKYFQLRRIVMGET